MIKLLAASALALTVALPAQAVTSITSLYSTGVNAAGVATTGNGADLHWVLEGGTAYTGGTNGQFPIGPWVADSATSRWITPTPTASDGNPVAPFTYSTTFSLTGFKVASASFSGSFAADDSVSAIILNGKTFSTGGGGYTSFTAFDSTGATFIKGTNTLTFVTYNGGAGPTGLNVSIAGTATVVPEAATWAMMVAGFALVGVAARRRARPVAA